MGTDVIERVQEFNQYYSELLGLLTDQYLGLDRPLGQARLLWEIRGRVGVRDLRDRLGLDSGYLSRLLRTLEKQDMVRIAPDPADGRAGIVQLTDAGLQERAALDKRCRAAVAALLAGLSPNQQDELVAAQRQVQRLLRLATITIAPAPADDARARQCLRQYAAELVERFPEGYDESTLTRPDDLDETLILACEQDRPVGCGMWVRLAPGIAEVRHLWTHPASRGLGLGRRLLKGIEADAATHGIGTLRLGTHRSLGEAIALYRGSGYQEIPAYLSSPYNQLCFEKHLSVSSIGNR
ncbi:GNAT family N-acetyltransferase [Asanoa iriomotensis]|uniref:PadR family transcriptional regulator n=1 Tax=Asanoa iriomotensis TaxID=234613 RepID=A0ABQ4C3W3_9ACTN|nr:GNAT family N-acetyltransferase [Asanoa iriomotensis]GIF57447.1 PadR family transcriptional regulator [Asanoa iriomotensis]